MVAQAQYASGASALSDCACVAIVHAQERGDVKPGGTLATGCDGGLNGFKKGLDKISRGKGHHMLQAMMGMCNICVCVCLMQPQNARYRGGNLEAGFLLFCRLPEASYGAL